MLTEDQREQLSTTQLTREPSLLEVAAMIAGQLGEDQEPQRQQLISIVRALGRTQAQALLRETLDIEAQGGMMLPDGSRCRTPGGIFFHLAYSKGQPKEGRKLVRPTYKKQKAGASPVPTPQPEPTIAFKWQDRIIVIREAEAQKGNANVKITLVGRPGKIVI
jgi:Phosphorylated adapter RNA export protein, RNA-binding domain